MSYSIRKQPQDLKALFFLALRSYFSVFQRLWCWLILLVVIKDFNLFLPFLRSPLTLGLIGWLQWSLLIYMTIVCVRIVHWVLSGQEGECPAIVSKTSLFSSLKWALFFVLAAAIFLVSFYIVAYLLRYLVHIGIFSHDSRSVELFLTVFYLPLLLLLFSYAMIRLIFVAPLLSLHRFSLVDAVIHSNELTLRYWFRLAIFYSVCVLFVLFSGQGTGIAMTASHYHLNVVFDLVWLSLGVPVVITWWLLLLDDLTERNQISEAGPS